MASAQDSNAVPNGAYFENDGRQPLLNVNDDAGEDVLDADEEEESLGCWYKLQRCMGWTVSKEQRVIHLDGKSTPRSFSSNTLNNQKYTLLSFLPLLLYNEFKFFFNMFFLLIALSQFVPFLKVGLLVTYVAPLVFVLTITMLKEAYDDMQRLRRDRELNLTKFERAVLRSDAGKESNRRNSGLQWISAKDIKVGMIIKVNHNQRLPADMLLLYTTEKSGSIFIRTDQLDGETDWKPRKSLSWTQKCRTPQDLLTSGGQVVA